MDVSPRWPTPEEQHQALHWTRRVPRPKAGDCADYLLAGRQEAWDESEAKRLAYEQGVAERRAERESAAAQAEAERTKAFEASEAEKAKQRESVLRGQYLSVPGNTQESWTRDRARVLSDDAVTRMRTAQSGALISPAAMLR